MIYYDKLRDKTNCPHTAKGVAIFKSPAQGGRGGGGGGGGGGEVGTTEVGSAFLPLWSRPTRLGRQELAIGLVQDH